MHRIEKLQMQLDAANRERPGMGASAGDAAAERLPEGVQPCVADDLRIQLELLQRQLKASQVPPVLVSRQVPCLSGRAAT